ncbi:MAG: hypothetical protein ACYTFK_14785 [Planctomycetota bacterium]|jgi:hypothetical protein
MDVLLRKIKQDVRSYNQFPATVDAVDSIVKAFGILEERIKQLSIQHMIDKENLALVMDRVKELENKQCCKDPSEPPKPKPKAEPVEETEKPTQPATPTGGKAASKKVKGDA